MFPAISCHTDNAKGLNVNAQNFSLLLLKSAFLCLAFKIIEKILLDRLTVFENYLPAFP